MREDTCWQSWPGSRNRKGEGWQACVPEATKGPITMQTGSCLSWVSIDPRISQSTLTHKTCGIQPRVPHLSFSHDSCPPSLGSSPQGLLSLPLTHPAGAHFWACIPFSLLGMHVLLLDTPSTPGSTGLSFQPPPLSSPHQWPDLTVSCTPQLVSIRGTTQLRWICH